MDRYSDIVDRIAVEQDVSHETARRHFEGALQFLELAASSHDRLTPSAPIDRAWHAFILHTEEYARYCHETLGRFVHHKPAPTRSGDSEMYSRTLELARSRFGDLDDDVWVDPSMWCRGQGTNCGPGGCWSPNDGTSRQ